MQEFGFIQTIGSIYKTWFWLLWSFFYEVEDFLSCSLDLVQINMGLDADADLDAAKVNIFLLLLQYHMVTKHVNLNLRVCVSAKT